MVLKEFNFRCTVKVKYLYAKAPQTGNEKVRIKNDRTNVRF